MNKSWNYIHKIGGAGALGEAQGEDYSQPTKAMLAACKAGRHKWMTRRRTRKCLRCGTEQEKDGMGNFSWT